MAERTRNATLVLMTLNELPSLRAIWHRIPVDLVLECFAVDGGSDDGTREFLQDRGIPVVDQVLPGWGEAARIGVANAITPNMVFFSPDGNQDPEDISRLLDALEEGYELVIASRFTEGAVHAEDGLWLRPRARGCRMFTAMANRLFDHAPRLTDATNGFRAITRDAMERLKLDAPGFELAYQMTLQALEQGLRVADIPTFEGPRIAGKSKLQTVPAGLQHLRVLVRETWRRRVTARGGRD